MKFVSIQKAEYICREDSEFVKNMLGGEHMDFPGKQSEMHLTTSSGIRSMGINLGIKKL